MAFDLGTIGAAVTLDTTDWRSKLNAMPREAESAGVQVAKIAATYFSGRAAVQFALAATKSYSDMQESMNRFNVVFESVGGRARRIGNELETVFGLSTRSAHDMLATTGDLLTGFNFSSDAALTLSERSAKLAIDLFSFTNVAGGAKAANQALAAAMTGEMERLKAYSIVIRQDSDEYKNLVKQYMEVEGMTLLQAKAMTALEMATRQSKNAIGDYLRPGRTLAQTQADLTEATEQFRAKVGEDLAGAMQGGMEAANSLMRTYNDLDPALRQVIVTTAAVAAGSMALKVALSGVATFRALEKKLSMETSTSQEREAVSTGSLTASIQAQTAAMQENSVARTLVNASRANDVAKKDFSVAKTGLADAESEKSKIDAELELKRVAVQAAQSRIESERTAHIEKVQHQQAEIVAERTKELAATRSTATQMAMEKVRHFEAMQNRTREAYAQSRGPVEEIRQKVATAMEAGPLPQRQMREFERQIRDAEAPYRKLQQETQKASQEMDVYIQKAKEARKTEIDGVSAINQKAEAAVAGASEHFRASKETQKSLSDEQRALSMLEKKQSEATQNVITQSGNVLKSKDALEKTENTLKVATESVSSSQEGQAKATKIGTAAMSAMRTGVGALATGMKALFASIGPIGWAMIGFSALSAVFSKMEENARKAADMTAELVDKAKEARSEGEKQRSSDAGRIQRLQELSTYSKLNNSEVQESQRLISELSSRYGDFGAAINETTGKLTLQKAAIDRLVESMEYKRKADIQSEITAIERNIKENEKLRSGWFRAFMSTPIIGIGNDPEGGTLLTDSVQKHDDPINKKINELYRIRAELKKELYGLDSGSTENFTTEQSQTSKALRDLQDRRFDFETSRLDLWNQGLAVQSRYMETEKALRDMQERGQQDSKEGIELQKRKLDLEQKYFEISKQIHEQWKAQTRFEQEAQKSYDQIVERRQNRAVDNAIEQYTSNNLFGPAMDIVYQQMAKAAQTAQEADTRYGTYMAQGYSRTDEGREILKGLQDIITKSASEEDRYADKAREIERQSAQRAKEIEASYAAKFDDKASFSIGAWSSETLAALVGASNPARETAANTKEAADNTREMVKQQRKMAGKVLVYED